VVDITSCEQLKVLASCTYSSKASFPNLSGDVFNSSLCIWDSAGGFCKPVNIEKGDADAGPSEGSFNMVVVLVIVVVVVVVLLTAGGIVAILLYRRRARMKRETVEGPVDRKTAEMEITGSSLTSSGTSRRRAGF
jgi:hypothetical protein